MFHFRPQLKRISRFFFVAVYCVHLCVRASDLHGRTRTLLIFYRECLTPCWHIIGLAFAPYSSRCLCRKSPPPRRTNEGYKLLSYLPSWVPARKHNRLPASVGPTVRQTKHQFRGLETQIKRQCLCHQLLYKPKPINAQRKKRQQTPFNRHFPFFREMSTATNAHLCSSHNVGCRVGHTTAWQGLDEALGTDQSQRRQGQMKLKNCLPMSQLKCLPLEKSA